MKSKRYLILPMEGIRLSDAPTINLPRAFDLLNKLQPGNKSGVASLSKRLAAEIKGGRSRVKTAKTAKMSPSEPPQLEVVKSLNEDGVKLVMATEEMVVAMRLHNPGIRIVEEKFCRPALAPRVSVPSRPKRAARSAAPAKVAVAKPLTIQVLRDGDGTPVKGAEVIAFRTSDDAMKGKTNASGKVSLRFGTAVSKLRRLYVYHEEAGIWGYFARNVAVSPSGDFEVRLAPIDLSVADALRHFHGPGSLADGEGVRVGIIDSGTDPDHPDLKDAIEGGANCVPGSSRKGDDFGPDGAHGTHVAGIVAARGSSPTGMRGVAPGAKLRIYRVFESGNEGDGSSFAIIDAIERAIDDRCDIINLSLAFPPGVIDDAISDALRKARNHGILAVAAAGNDGRQPVSFPGSDSHCVAVSAAGRKKTFPATATEVDDVAAPYGNDPGDFLGAFSNVGGELDATGAGVGVVSTFPGGYGAMSGTSMACPAVSGVAARILSKNAGVMSMPRDAARCDAIRGLLMDACKPLGFDLLFEGGGLPK